MKNKILYIIIVILVLIIIGGGLIFFSGNKDNEKESSADNQEMVDCGKLENPYCFFNRMNECLPVTAKLTGMGGEDIEITILGVENEKCHFQRKVNGVINLNCYFPKGTLSWDTIDQTFGNDHGAEAQAVVDEACKPAGW